MFLGSMRVYALLFLMLVASVFVFKCYSHIESLKEEIISKDMDIVNLERQSEIISKQMITSQLESERYKAALKEQSSTIESHSQKYRLSQAELSRWRADAKKYESIEKHLPPQTIIYRSNCEDITNYFDSLDGFSLDRLQ